MMEEDDVSKISKELQDAALTDVTQAAYVKENSPPLLTSEINKEPTPPRAVETMNPIPPFSIETLVSSIPSVGFDSNPIVTPGKAPLQPASSYSGAGLQPSFHQHQDVNQSQMSGFNQPTQDVMPSPPAHAQQSANPYRAISGFGAHVSHPNVGPTNIFVPPSVQEVPRPQPVYQPQAYAASNQSFAPPSPPYAPPTSSYAPPTPPYAPPTQSYTPPPQYGAPYDGHSHHHQCSGGHSHGYGSGAGESFLEIPQDAGMPSWDYGHHSQAPSDGLFGWFSNVGNKVFEKTKSSVESMITTLDPGMKAVLYSGGSVDVIVTTSNVEVVEGIRQAFQEVFGRASVNGTEARSDIAPQPVGFTAGLRGAENKIEDLRRSAAVHECQPLVSVESFIQEVFPDKWFEFSCLVLKDPLRNIDLTTFTQATPINPTYIQQAQESTPSDYDLRWSGLSLTIGEIIARNQAHIHPHAWHKDISGVSRHDNIYGAAKVLATLYKNQCR